MRGLLKSKRVSWPSDVNLCQVRLFSSEESPAQVGLGAEDHLQVKPSWPHSAETGFDDNLPPGFEGTHPTNVLKNKLSQIPLVKWTCPPRFVLDFTWQVVAGNESKQAEIQNQREMRVLEAVYPRPSAIPPNPSLLMGIEDSHQSDLRMPQIPITPVEDEDAAADALFDKMAPNNVSLPAAETSARGMAHAVEPDVVTAAYTALTAAMKNNDQGNLIDRDLLVKILCDPKLIENLATAQGAPTIAKEIIPNQRPPGITSCDPPPVHVNRAEAAVGPFYPIPRSVGPVPNMRPPLHEVVSVPPPPVSKDINYYKSLIQQHGGERQDTLQHLPSHQNLHLESTNNPRLRDSKPRIMKPCIYFNSSRGCRHGVNCVYQHDASSQQRVSVMLPGVQSAKRMKMDREITGT